MAKSKETQVTVSLSGIGYPAFARLKWAQFLRGFSLAVAIFIAGAIVLAATGKMPREIPVTVPLVLLLAVLALLALYRGAIRREYKAAGLAAMALQYQFDRDGWTVKKGQAQTRILWSNTWRVRRNDQALLLYPNRRSVNLVPLSAMTPAQAERIIAWCTGKK